MSSSGLRYRKTIGGYAVTGVGECRDEDVFISGWHDDLPVVEIAGGAFEGCRFMHSVDIPDTVVRIGPGAFASSGLRDVYFFGNPAMSIGSGAFDGCDVWRVYVSDLAAWCASRFEDPGANPLRRARMLYVDEREAYNLVIPEGVEEIGPYAFFGCGAIMGVTLPRSLRRIGDDAFGDCFNLLAVCNLSALDIRAGGTDNGLVARHAERIYSAAEAGRASSNARRDEHGHVFYDAGFGLYYAGYIGEDEDLRLSCPDGRVCEINERAFYGRQCLYNVSIPDGVKSIGREAFCRCDHLQRVTIGRGTARVGDRAFAGCTRLARVTMGDGITEIGAGAFDGCEYIEEVDLPDGLVSVGERAFNRCRGLKSVIVPASIRFLGDDAFRDTGEDTVFYCLCDGRTWDRVTARWDKADPGERHDVSFCRDRREVEEKMMDRRGSGFPDDPRRAPWGDE